MLGCGSNTGAQSTRREVSVGGQRIRTVDIHAHCVFPAATDLIAGTPLEGIGMAEFQTLGPGRLDEMNMRGVDYQALSVNRYWWYEADRDLASSVVRLHDESLAEWCNEHPDRFVALSSVALQFPELAAEQLEHAVNELGHRGASVGGHVNGDLKNTTRSGLRRRNWACRCSCIRAAPRTSLEKTASRAAAISVTSSVTRSRRPCF
jgi:aminocarboxymuconate-semialdehyde decarboxylase